MKLLFFIPLLLLSTSFLLAKDEVERVASFTLTSSKLNYPEKRNLLEATAYVFEKAGLIAEEGSSFLDPTSRRDITQIYVAKDMPPQALRAEMRLRGTGLDVDFDTDKSFRYNDLKELLAQLEQRCKSRLPSAKVRIRLSKAWDDSESAAAVAAVEPALASDNSNSWLNQTSAAQPVDVSDEEAAMIAEINLAENGEIPPATVPAGNSEVPVAQPVSAGNLDDIDLEALERQLTAMSGEVATNTSADQGLDTGGSLEDIDLEALESQLKAMGGAEEVSATRLPLSENSEQSVVVDEKATHHDSSGTASEASETHDNIRTKIDEIRAKRNADQETSDDTKLNDLNWGN